MKKGTNFFLDDLQLRVFTLSYTLSVIFIFWLLSFFLVKFDVIVLIISSLIFLILATLGWAYLHVLFSIPQRIAQSFDPIKNDISHGKISSTKDFAREICNFLVVFYNYSFFDIRYSAMKIGEKEIFFSADEIKESMDWHKVEQEISLNKEKVVHQKIWIDKNKFYPYSVPVIFGDQLLGFFTVFSSGRLGKQRLKLLSDLEDFYIDDQLVHVINMEKKT
ncbi:MAG: hypothetical protein ACOCWA_03535 [Bacteroidota bacterium]